MLITLKKIAHKIFNRLGFDIIKHSHFDSGLAGHIATILKSREIDCVLDVGANIGQYGQFLRKIGFNGYIVSFEPVKAVFDILKNNSKDDPKWICYNLALSNESQAKEINVYSGTQFCSFLDVNEFAKNIWDDIDKSKKEIVDVIQLDDFFAEIETKTGCHNFYLKLDTQGFDLNVFLGALNTLEKIKAMQSELALISVYENMPNPYAVLNKYHENEYFISGLYPINRDESLAVIEYDCVLVRRQGAEPNSRG